MPAVSGCPSYQRDNVEYLEKSIASYEIYLAIIWLKDHNSLPHCPENSYQVQPFGHDSPNPNHIPDVLLDNPQIIHLDFEKSKSQIYINI